MHAHSKRQGNPVGASHRPADGQVQRGADLMSVEAQTAGPAAELYQLRAEARRDLRLIRIPLAVAGTIVAATAGWGPEALLPICAVCAATILVAISLGVWGTYIRGWRVLRLQSDRF